MSHIVHVQHPVPVRYIPKGGRLERFAFKRAVTPIPLREVDPGALAHVYTLDKVVNPNTPGRPSYHLFEDRLWMRLQGWHPRNRHGLEPFGPDGFIRYLMGGVGQKAVLDSDLDWCLRGTPLCASHDVMPASGGPVIFGLKPAPRNVPMTQSRGDDLDGDIAEARRVFEDCTARCVDDVTRFVTQEVLLAGDGVYVRTPAPLLRGEFGGMCQVSHYPRSTPDLLCYGRLDRANDLREFGRLRGNEHQGSLLAQVKGLQAAFEGLSQTDDDLLVFANHAPRAALKSVGFALVGRDPARVRDALPCLARKVEAMQPWHVRAMTGAISLDEAEEVVMLARDLMRETYDLNGASLFFHLRSAANFADEYVLPRLRERALVAEEDIVALASM